MYLVRTDLVLCVYSIRTPTSFIGKPKNKVKFTVRTVSSYPALSSFDLPAMMQMQSDLSCTVCESSL